MPSTRMPDLRRFPLIDGRSPLHRLRRFSRALGGGVDVWIKREDLLPVGLGGNKLRNLEYLIGAAQAERADTLVTVGRRWSNHARLTAAAGARAGLDVHLVLSGPPLTPTNPGVALDELFGAIVHVAASADRAVRATLLDEVLSDLRAAGRRPYVIGTGGSGPTGATGQVFAGLEAFDQAVAAGIAIDRIVVPSATGGTQAGLLVAAARTEAGARIHGVVVAWPDAELRPAIASMVEALGELFETDVAASTIELDSDQLGEGYGRPTASAAEATRLLARTEGLLVDPIYTAKGLADLVAHVRAGDWDGETVVFWHSGGLPGLFEPLD